MFGLLSLRSMHMADDFVVVCNRGDVETVRDSLAQGADPNTVHSIGHPAVCAAAQNGHVAVCEVLISSGVNLEAKQAGGGTALFAAAEKAHAEVAALLLKHGAAVDAAQNEGATPLFIAAQNAHAEVAALLLKHGAAVDAARNDSNTPLIVAARKGNAEIAALLLAHGAAVDAADTDGGTPLIMAAQDGHTAVVRALLLAGADTAIKGGMSGSRNKKGNEALVFAEHFGHRVVAYLLRNPPPPTAQQDLCAARQRLALVVGMVDESHAAVYAVPPELARRVCEEAHVLLGALMPLDRLRRVCEEAQAASTLRIWRAIRAAAAGAHRAAGAAAALPAPAPEPGRQSLLRVSLSPPNSPENDGGDPAAQMQSRPNLSYDHRRYHPEVIDHVFKLLGDLGYHWDRDHPDSLEYTAGTAVMNAVVGQEMETWSEVCADQVSAKDLAQLIVDNSDVFGRMQSRRGDEWVPAFKRDPATDAAAAAAAVRRAQGSSSESSELVDHRRGRLQRLGSASGAGPVPRGQHRFTNELAPAPAALEVSAEERVRAVREAAIRRQDAAAAEAAEAAEAASAAAAAVASAAASAPAAEPAAADFTDIDAALAKITNDNVDTVAGNRYLLRVVPAGLVEGAVKVLVKVLGNIVTNPGEAKFRRLKKTNKMVEGKLLPCRGAVQLLIACGFRSADGVLSLADDKVDLSRLEYAVDRLGRLEEDKQAVVGDEAKAAEAARTALFKQQQEAKREEAQVKLAERQKVEERAEFARRAKSDNTPWEAEPAAEPGAEPPAAEPQ